MLISKQGRYSPCFCRSSTIVPRSDSKFRPRTWFTWSKSWPLTASNNSSLKSLQKGRTTNWPSGKHHLPSQNVP